MSSAMSPGAKELEPKSVGQDNPGWVGPCNGPTELFEVSARPSYCRGTQTP